MDAILFEQWVKEMDQKTFLKEKIHHHVDNLKVFFTPPDTNFKMEPMNEGVIKVAQLSGYQLALKK